MKNSEVNLGERTTAYALCAVKLFRSLPKTPEAGILGNQFLRSATSVGANYRETRRARSRAEFISTFGLCLKELDETAYWLELMDQSGIFKASQIGAIRRETEELIAIVVTILKKSRLPSPTS